MLGAILLWPLFSYREASMLREFGNPDVFAQKHRPKAWCAALRHNVPASEYFGFGLWRAEAAPVDNWLYTRESSLLTAHLTDSDVSDLVGDKVRFAEFCTQNGSLNVVKTLAVFQDGAAVVDFENERVPLCSLISKPVRTSMGRGFEYWSFTDGVFTASMHAEHSRISPDQLPHKLAKASLKRPSGLVVQPALLAHDNIADLSRHGPSVARIITGRWHDGQVEVLDAMLQKPLNKSYRTHGGSYCLLDPETGNAIARLPSPHLIPAATDDPAFDDVCLPDWESCTSGLIQLHSVIQGQSPLLGWDIVFTPDGPTILEANTTLAPYFFQLASQQPAGDGKWISLLAGYLP